MNADPHQILLSKTNMTREDIQKLSVGEAWRLVYELPKVRKTNNTAPSVCFTGFSGPEEESLIALAQQCGMRTASSVTKTLSILCCGPTPGPAKLKKAEEQGVTIMSEADFRNQYSAS